MTALAEAPSIARLHLFVDWRFGQEALIHQSAASEELAAD